ncbi:MAG: Coenzyme F420 hydrogenase/dehydrogenase, beta subunit C-terminal domain [Phascolarctobacterium faecium]
MYKAISALPTRTPKTASGRPYCLFSGTPCQIGGLKGYLRKDYERLYTIDVVCHGVPSPKVYQKRLDEVTELSSSPVIKSISAIKLPLETL